LNSFVKVGDSGAASVPLSTAPDELELLDELLLDDELELLLDEPDELELLDEEPDELLELLELDELLELLELLELDELLELLELDESSEHAATTATAAAVATRASETRERDGNTVGRVMGTSKKTYGTPVAPMQGHRLAQGPPRG
jgi:hypothetical protein